MMEAEEERKGGGRGDCEHRSHANAKTVLSYTFLILPLPPSFIPRREARAA